jgi:flagellar hook assembly protein FlgD
MINQDSTSALKTFTLSNQVSGPISVTWDGHADNGLLVAPGGYTINVAVTDSMGNVTQQRVLSTVQY